MHRALIQALAQILTTAITTGATRHRRRTWLAPPAPWPRQFALHENFADVAAVNGNEANRAAILIFAARATYGNVLGAIDETARFRCCAFARLSLGIAALTPARLRRINIGLPNALAIALNFVRVAVDNAKADAFLRTGWRSEFSAGGRE